MISGGFRLRLDPGEEVADGFQIHLPHDGFRNVMPHAWNDHELCARYALGRVPSVFDRDKRIVRAMEDERRRADGLQDLVARFGSMAAM